MNIVPGRTSLISSLQAIIHTQLRASVTGSFALVDFPDHANVGDSAIYLGELEYFRENYGLKPDYVCSFRDYSKQRLVASVPSGTIFIHGGGNFGDLYPVHQALRNQILDDFPDRLIVQLPQSIEFMEKGSIESTKDAIDRHPSFRLLVRDQPSFGFAEEHFDCAVAMCPDMAFCLGAIDAPPATTDVFTLLRGDKESRFSISDYPDGVRAVDWMGENRWHMRWGGALGMAKAALSGGLTVDALKRGKYAELAKIRVDRGVRQLASGRRVVTDRLHAHILSLLIGRPHAVLDNSYQKIARYMDAWGSDSPLTYRATSLADAFAWAQGSK